MSEEKKIKKENWVVITKKADFYRLAKIFNVDPVIIRLLVNRGVATEEEIKNYLTKEIDDIHDIKKLKDIELAVRKIIETIEAEKVIVIASDFDVDGIFSGQLLLEALLMLGAKAVLKTPHRVLEGYGLNKRIVDDAVGEDAGLILTCDNGIAAFEAVDYANEKGIPVIVTDHHEVPYDEVDGEKIYRIPNALATINPHQEDCDYPFDGLCGCGVALKLVQRLFEIKGISVPDVFYEYAAIATICDVMKLTDENRAIIKKGIKSLRESKSIGLSALIDACEIDKKNISAHHIGFILGPCFNAAGRLETTEKAAALLSAKDVGEAANLAGELKKLNDVRKQYTDDAVTKAIAIIEENDLKNDKVILVCVGDCHESVAGIVAGRIRELYNKPAFVFTQTEDCLKGSGRSIDGYHMYEELSKHKDLLLRFGGHALAAGLSLPQENMERLRASLNDNCELSEEDFIPVVKIDAAMPIDYVTEALIEQFELLEPLGNANPKPVFAEKGLKVKSARLIGKNKNILKLVVENERGCKKDALLFSGAEDFVAEALSAFGEAEWEKALWGEENCIEVDLAYFPSINEYMGMREIQIKISHFRFR